MSNPDSAMQQYRNVQRHGAVPEASPHQLIAMLFNGALDNLAAARGAIERGDVQTKGEKLGRAIAIIDNLRAALDMDVGGGIAENLRNLYDYMETRLLRANVDSDLAAVDEVVELIRQIKSGWDGIAGQPEAKTETAGQV